MSGSMTNEEYYASNFNNSAVEEIGAQRDRANQRLEKMTEEHRLMKERLMMILSITRQTYRDDDTRLGEIEHEAEHCLSQIKH